MKFARMLLIIVALCGAALAAAQDAPADNMAILKEKLQADKKLVVAANMDLTEAEAAKFWPVYTNYQKDLQGINQQLGKLIDSYATEYNANTLTDDKAKKLVDDMLKVEQAELDLQKSYVPKLNAVLPARKVARYLQLENKIRAVGKYELASAVPLVE